MDGGARTPGRTIAAAVAIGCAVAALSWMAFSFTHGADFAQFHFHARNWLAGRDPYVGGFPRLLPSRETASRARISRRFGSRRVSVPR